MIPLQLTLEGLYSYQERQTIDFRSLTEAGLFGIFGAVGSGKSSILEAISFALYGETERLNSRDKRAYNMMNLKANSSFIQFDFINHENKIFRAAREFRRNSKKFEDVKASSVTFYEKQNDKWIPLEHSDCEKIIGLSYANFKRTIIIPQGQFKEFLELGAAERTNMMKEIFNLKQFDLQNNAAVLSGRNKSELDQLEGQLKGFDEISEEKIAASKETLLLAQQKFDEVSIEFKKTDDQYRNLKNLKTDFELLNSKKANYTKLLPEKENIDKLEIETERYDRLFRIFNPLIAEKNKLQAEVKNVQNELASNAAVLKETVANSDRIKKDMESVLPRFEALEQSKIEENDLNLILQMLTSSTEIKTLRARTENGSAKVKEVESAQDSIKQKVKELTAQLEDLKPKKLDANLLLNVGNWFSANKNLVESLQKQVSKTDTLREEIQKTADELKPFDIEIERIHHNFKWESDLLENRKKEVSVKKSQLEVQQKLARFANELHHGESCPLCGALEHPHIVEFNDVNAELSDIQKQLDSIDHQQKAIQMKVSAVEKILERKKLLLSQLETEEENVNMLKSQLENHQNLFIWKEFDSDNETVFNNKRTESFEIEKQLEELTKKIASEQKNLESGHENLNKFTKALEEFKLKEKEVETQISTNEYNLKILGWMDYKEKTFEEVGKLYTALSKRNLETEQSYQKLITAEKEISLKLASQKTTVLQLERRILELREEVSANEMQTNNALTLNKFSSLNEITLVLSQEINVAQTRNRIQKFRIEFETLKNGIAELETKLQGFNFDEAQFKEVESQFKTLETEKTHANDTVVKLASEIERLLIEFGRKEGLLKELSKLQKRAENLKIMTNLFKGAGFVQYVSSIYLRQLCDHANVRFHRMTRNQLSLQLNDNNDFEIIDYLNEGRCRSVKTLSGGQAFQVSLSLALALAESVQTNASAEKNFFFIDEGFGTQDLESVNVVFETLMSLQEENRIVGIISHVEELKEKIPVSLNITKDEERGSLIEVM